MLDVVCKINNMLEVVCMGQGHHCTIVGRLVWREEEHVYVLSLSEQPGICEIAQSIVGSMVLPVNKEPSPQLLITSEKHIIINQRHNIIIIIIIIKAIHKLSLKKKRKC